MEQLESDNSGRNAFIIGDSAALPQYQKKIQLLGMNLIIRPATLRDLPSGMGCIRDHFLHEEPMRPRLLALWQELLTNGSGLALVIVDQDAHSDTELLAFAIGAFLTPPFVEELRPQPRRHHTDSARSPLARGGTVAVLERRGNPPREHSQQCPADSRSNDAPLRHPAASSV